MERKDFASLGISEGLMDIYFKNKQIINENGVFKISGDLLIRIFLDNLKKGESDYSMIITFSDDEFAKCYVKLLSNLYCGNREEAKKYLQLININYKNNQYQDIIDLYNYILNKKELDNLRITYDDNMYVGRFVNIAKKYLKKQQYILVSDILDRIISIDANVYLQILRNVCRTLPTNMHYIVDEGKIKDQATRDGIAKMERKMLIDLEFGESLLMTKNFNDLVSFEVCGDIYENILSLLNIVDYFKTHTRCISNHDFNIVCGEFDSVVKTFIQSEDFYRLRSVVDDAMEESEHPAIKVQIYKILSDAIMYYNSRNKELIDRERTISLDKNNEKWLMEKYPLSSIRVDTIYEEIPTLATDFSKNYYQVYQDYYEAKKYKEAKNALQQFKVNQESLSVRINLDYLFKELDILIFNEQVDDEDKKHEETLLSKAESIEDTDPNQAITLYKEALKYQARKNPRIMSKIGELYYKSNDYEKALTYYREASKDFLYLEDYIMVMELLIKTRRYKDVDYYAYKYESYYPEENAYVQYLLSIAYIHQHLYDAAEDALQMADAINACQYNVSVSYTREHEIIGALKRGEDVKPFTMEDFVNYDLNTEEKKLLKHIRNLKKADAKNYISNLKREGLNQSTWELKIAYLLMLIKIFNYQEEEEQVDDLIEFVEKFIKSEDELVCEDIQKKLSIYKIR